MSKKQKDEFLSVSNGIYTVIPLDIAKRFMKVLSVCIGVVGLGVTDYAIEENILIVPIKIICIVSMILAAIFYIHRYFVDKKGATRRQKLVISTYVFIDMLLIGIMLSMAYAVVALTKEDYSYFLLFAIVVISMFSFFLYKFLRRSKQQVKIESSKSPIIALGSVTGVAIARMLKGELRDIVSIAVLLLICGFLLSMSVLGVANLIVLKQGDVIDLDV